MRCLICLPLLAAVIATAATAAPVQFNRDIRPILSDKCFACHGFDAKHRKADLRLDTREGALADLKGTRAIVPGKLNESELWHRINSDDEDEIMPPPDSHKTISDAERATIKQWILEGAEYQAHWSFVPPALADIPEVTGTDNPIDAYLQDRLKQLGLRPAPLADRETLIRRATLDLTGLPPTTAEIDAFLADSKPDAFSRLIDALMARPTYGEHMASDWLDLARFGDTHGLHLDNERSMWPYRDWVVRAFNDNLPFDEFTRWQLAGDLLPEPTQDQQIASGFNRCNVTTGEGGSINEEWVYRNAVDRTATAVEVWMGLTAGCAVCHDHKFDPLSTKEFYEMYAFFHSAADPALDGNKLDTPPIMRITTPESKAETQKLEAEVAKLKGEFDTAIAAYAYTDPATLSPPPGSSTNTAVWFEDGFPAGARVQYSGGPAIKLVGKDEGPVYSGEKALTRTSDAVISQDFWNGGASFTVPQEATFFLYAWLDADNPPETIMVQFHTGGWNQRAVWGAQEKITFGNPNTHQKVYMGKLPELGKWVRLSFPASQLGLKAGTKVDGYAFTQFGGTVTWDHFGVDSIDDPAGSPSWSWSAWKAQPQKARDQDLSEALRRRYKDKKPADWTPSQDQELQRHWLGNVYAGADPAVTAIKDKRTSTQAKLDALIKSSPVTFVMADMKKPRKSFVMLRGQYDNPGEEVRRNVPAFLPPLPPRPSEGDYNRLDLANWLLGPEHPLTARVAANRLWQQFFGMGLVQSSSDFGSQGGLPSHPELLDWLAIDFVEHGWDVRRMIKGMMLSHAYQQASRLSPELLETDPKNRWLSRAPRLRLDAEVLRDQALYVSGLLVPTMGGRGVRPYQPPNIWEPIGFGNSNTRNYNQGSGDDLYRRSIYTFFKRTAPPPFMSTFDAPNREQSCPSRGRSNTPMQALQLMNDIQHVEAARNLAQRLLTPAGLTDAQRINRAWRTVTARIPQADEVDVVSAALNQHRTRYAADTEAATQLISYGESKADPALPPAELAAWTMIANLLLNLDEVVTKN